MRFTTKNSSLLRTCVRARCGSVLPWIWVVNLCIFVLWTWICLMYSWIRYVVDVSVCVWWGESKKPLLFVSSVSVVHIVYAYVHAKAELLMKSPQNSSGFSLWTQCISSAMVYFPRGAPLALPLPYWLQPEVRGKQSRSYTPCPLHRKISSR